MTTEIAELEVLAGTGKPTKILGILIGFKVVLLFVLAWNSRFVMDEFVQLGFAKYFGHGLFETVWPAKAVGYTAFAELAHLIGWNAVSILLTGRMLGALLACGIIAMVYACARALGEDRVRALIIVLVLLCFSNFMERSFRTRAEPLAVFFAVTALLVVLRGQVRKAQTVLLAGFFSGLSFLATQKAVYFDVALGLGLVVDAALARRYREGVLRGMWLVLGWLTAIAAYCFIFGGRNPLPVASNLVFGPVEVATMGGGEYGGLRHFVLQTLMRNAVLYAFCFSGLIISLMRIGRLDEARRIALIFSVVITVLIFSHDQPWPYVFVMALPFLALWVMVPFDTIATQYRRLASIALIVAVAISYASNLAYLRIGNADQIELVTRAEKLLGPDEEYFDAVGMLPNRQEPSTLWLDVHYVLKTLRQGTHSEAYKILSQTPPKVILWSYRLKAVYPVIKPLVQDSYVRVAPNVRMAGRRLRPGQQVHFSVPLAGRYGLYTEAGTPLSCEIKIEGRVVAPPFDLATGAKTVTLQACPVNVLIVPEGAYAGLFNLGDDYDDLFADVYN